MRGTRRFMVSRTVLRGIIPAHAGNTPPGTRFPACAGDHPRACGEHAIFFRMSAARWGSSPRMRGTQGHETAYDREDGIIPAHAGNTILLEPTWGMVWDHPRACGEHYRRHAMTFWFRGSSPRMRGTLCLVLFLGVSSGIIPAHAGNTRC